MHCHRVMRNEPQIYRNINRRDLAHLIFVVEDGPDPLGDRDPDAELCGAFPTQDSPVSRSATDGNSPQEAGGDGLLLHTHGLART